MRTRTLAMMCALLTCATSVAADWPEVFIDPVDHRLDASRWVLDRRGFLPVPMIITGPAIGYGGGVMLAFFHRNEQHPSQSAEFVPPSISAVGGAATENGTKFAALGHLGRPASRNRRRARSAGVGVLPSDGQRLVILIGRERR